MKAPITHSDGTGTVENLVSEVSSVLTDDMGHEITLWNNGSISIAGLIPQGSGGDHAQLDRHAIRTLRDFLPSPKGAALLASA